MSGRQTELRVLDRYALAGAQTHSLKRDFVWLRVWLWAVVVLTCDCEVEEFHQVEAAMHQMKVFGIRGRHDCHPESPAQARKCLTYVFHWNRHVGEQRGVCAVAIIAKIWHCPN
jgi:hypothetical protein